MVGGEACYRDTCIYKRDDEILPGVSFRFFLISKAELCYGLFQPETSYCKHTGCPINHNYCRIHCCYNLHIVTAYN